MKSALANLLAASTPEGRAQIRLRELFTVIDSTLVTDRAKLAFDAIRCAMRAKTRPCGASRCAIECGQTHENSAKRAQVGKRIPQKHLRSLISQMSQLDSTRYAGWSDYHG